MVELRELTEDIAKIYFKKANTEIIRNFLSQKVITLEEALEDYRHTLLPDANSFRKTIWSDNYYDGDVWAYCIYLEDNLNTMISYYIF